VHRDLKPENTMVAEFGEVLVLDWGIARIPNAEPGILNSEPRTPNSEPVVVAGTPRFMPPEQMRGDAEADHRVDVYALGVMLEMMGDAAPLAAIAHKACAADPAARYQTVQALAADVNRFLAGRAVEAHRERLHDRAARVWRRYKLPILLVLTYLAVRVLLLWLARV